ncbi:MAG: tetratricopeptide repeat protein [Proteobacteria bacterium]|nr:tetratricopeptide repeat protein [Pseudomonadota bacterium]
MRNGRARSRGLRLGAVAALLFAFVCGGPGWADDHEKKKERKRSYTVGEQAYKRLQRVIEHLDAEKYDEARAALDSLSRKKGLNPHEQAMVYQMYGSVYAGQEKYAEAADAIQKAVALDALPEGSQLAAQYNLAQLYMAQENYPKAITTLKAWFARSENPGSPAYYLLAACYAQQERLDLAYEPARIAVEKSSSPRESWLQLLLAIRFERKEYKQVAGLLEQLVTRFPRKTYWRQLSAIYSELKRDRDALAVLQIAYQQGFLDTDRELRNLAQMYLYQQIPYRAARVLEKGLEEGKVEKDTKAYELLANSWLYAREFEKAMGPLAKAAEGSDDGELYLRLAQVHLEREAWKEAEATLRKAIRKGELKDQGQVQLLLGISRYNLKKWDGAKKAFQAAAKSEKHAASAAQWMRHVARDERRQS